MNFIGSAVVKWLLMFPPSKEAFDSNLCGDFMSHIYGNFVLLVVLPPA